MSIEVLEFADVYLFRFGPLFAWEDLMELHQLFKVYYYPPPDHWRHRLIDLRQTRAIDLDYQRVTEYVRLLTSTPAPPDLKIALVVASPLILGYARMFQTLIDPVVQRVEIFEEMAPALDWLAVVEVTRQALAPVSSPSKAGSP
ncbi:MAG: hypothetical protein Kow0031_29870 [Anaerolineae bacterium]